MLALCNIVTFFLITSHKRIFKKMKDLDITPIKTYTKKELRILYNISEDTFRRWINRIIYRLPNYDAKCKILSPLQVKVFFEYYGEP
jgi:hypothetical protein